MNIGLPTILAVAHQYNGGTEVSRVTNKAGGVADSAGGIRQHLQVVIGWKIHQRAQPWWSPNIPKTTDSLADMICTSVDVWPQQHRLHLQGLEAHE
jgi:hypothetical protein